MTTKEYIFKDNYVTVNGCNYDIYGSLFAGHIVRQTELNGDSLERQEEVFRLLNKFRNNPSYDRLTLLMNFVYN